MSELPEGWAETTLGELGEWRGGGTPSKQKAVFWNGDIPWVSPKDMKREFIDDAEDKITSSAVEESATQLIPSGSVLIVTRSGILRHTLPIAINTNDLTVNQDLKALSPAADIDVVFIARQLRSEAQNILSACAKSGTTVDSVDFERLKAFPFRLSPLAEQRRIVAKLDTLTGATARARAELDRIPALIARYKQAILSAAFTGELTKEWRDRRSQPDPEFTEVGSLVADLHYGTAQKCYPDIKGTPVLRISNVISGRIDFTDLKYGELDERTLKKLRLQEGDILVVRSNGSVELVGRTALVTPEAVGFAYAGYLIRIRPDTHLVIPRFLALILETPQIRRVIETGARSTSGVHNVNSTELSALSVPRPNLPEQREIVRRIETAFAWLDRMAAEHEKATRLLPRLDQEILAKAFRGELVPQDPSDEPASVLLERIRAQRAAEPAALRRRPGRKAHGTVQEISRVRKGRAVTKTRKEVGATYLSDLLQKLGGSAHPQELWRQSDMSIDEFYKLLREEVKAGRIAEAKDKERLVIRHAA